MNARFLTGVILAYTCLTTTHPVFAQSAKSSPQHPFRVSLGMFLIGEATTRDYLKPITTEVGYDFLRLGTKVPVTFQAYAEYWLKDSGNQRGGDLRLTLHHTFGIGVSARTSLLPTDSVSPYIGGGVGYYVIKASSTERSPDDFGGPDGGALQRNCLSPRFFLGIQARNGIFVEAAYQFLPGFEKINYKGDLRGINLRVGYAF